MEKKLKTYRVTRKVLGRYEIEVDAYDSEDALVRAEEILDWRCVDEQIEDEHVKIVR